MKIILKKIASDEVPKDTPFLTLKRTLFFDKLSPLFERSFPNGQEELEFELRNGKRLKIIGNRNSNSGTWEVN